MNIPIKYVLLSILLVGMFFLSLWLGTTTLSFNEFISSIETNSQIFQLRFIRALTAIFAGGGIALTGLLLQTLFKNPLVGPSVLGVTSGATLGVATSISLSSYFLFFNSIISQTLFSIIGSILVVIILLIASKYIKNSNTILIIGLMISYFISSIVNVFSYFIDKSNLQYFVYWGLGSFSKELNLSVIYTYVTIITLLIIFSLILIKRLDFLLLGEQYAQSSGINTKQTRFLIILISGVLIGIITAWCGPIAFLGIAVPHLAKNLMQTSKHYKTIIATLFIGAVLALGCDITARLPSLSQSLPINAITSFIGAPIVIWIIFKRKLI